MIYDLHLKNSFTYKTHKIQTKINKPTNTKSILLLKPIV